MIKKRTSLEAVLGEPPSLAESESTPRGDSRHNPVKPSGKRPGIKQQTAYLALPVL